ncbi:MAG TPA: hypothetical protein PKE47_03040, partial [Verrucomicrobiota bacterium]|nr:hypothetical protein [Verrucomicrobiota bacterium]
TIYNTGDQTGDPHLHTRLAFSPGLGAIDWVSLVFQNSEQQDDPDHVPGPGGGGDGLVSISLYQQMDLTMGTLSGLLGTTDAQTIPEGTLGWFTFQFPETVNLTPGATYYLAFNISEGYSVDTAGVYGNVSSEFRPYNFWYDQFWESRGSPMSVLTTANEFLFAEGVITAIPEPAQAAAVAGASLFLAAMLRRKLRQRRK